MCNGEMVKAICYRFNQYIIMKYSIKMTNISVLKILVGEVNLRAVNRKRIGSNINFGVCFKLQNTNES